MEFLFKLLITEILLFFIILFAMHPDGLLGNKVCNSNLDYGKTLDTMCIISISIICLTILFIIWN